MWLENMALLGIRCSRVCLPLSNWSPSGAPVYPRNCGQRWGKRWPLTSRGSHPRRTRHSRTESWMQWQKSKAGAMQTQVVGGRQRRLLGRGGTSMESRRVRRNWLTFGCVVRTFKAGRQQCVKSLKRKSLPKQENHTWININFLTSLYKGWA